MRELARDQLAVAGPARWRAFLKDGLSAFHQNRNTDLGTRAFLPLVVRPRGHNPAGELAAEILVLLEGKKSIAAKAVSDVLSSWKIALDGPAGATMGVELATRLDAPGLGRICLRLIEENAPMDQTAADALVWSAIRAIQARGTAAQAVALGQSISRVGLWSPTLAAEFAAMLGGFGLSEMPSRLLKAMPTLLAEPHTGQYARELAHRLALDYTPTELEATFAAHERDTEELSRFRRTLSSELGFDDIGGIAAAVTGEKLQEIVDRASRETPEDNSTSQAERLFRAARQSPGARLQ